MAVPDYQTPDWMTPHIESDVQTAIQSQTIQTPFEKQSSALTDTAFQSYLMNAPIPRAYFLEQATNTTLTSGAEVTVVFGLASRVFDPYAMLSATANTFKIPIDGFYSMVLGIRWPIPAGSGSAVTYAGFKAISGSYAANTYLGLQQINQPIQAGATNTSFSVPLIKPFRSGDTFICIASQTSGVNEASVLFDTSSPYLSISWVAPYQNYSIQSGGN